MGYRIAPHQPDPKPTKKVAKKDSYRAFVKKLPCCITGQEGVDVCHVSFANTWYGNYGRGRGTKVSDVFTVPMAPERHRWQHSMNEEIFWQMHNIDPHELAVTLWAIFSAYGDDAEELCRARIMQGIER